jgi:hypothetical protein
MTKFTSVYPGQWSAIDHDGNEYMIFHTKHIKQNSPEIPVGDAMYYDHSQNSGIFRVYYNGEHIQLPPGFHFRSAREALKIMKRITEIPYFTEKEEW